MTTPGLSQGFAAALLNVVNNTDPAIGTVTAIQLHTGQPGTAGTANVSAVTTRQAATFSAVSAGPSPQLQLASSPSAWDMTETETIAFISVWTDVTYGSGTFLWSAQLGTSKSVSDGDTLTLNSCTLSFSPVAAT